MATLVAQYFLNHRLDPEEIEWQMEELAKAGYQGVYAHARPGMLTPYMSEEWWRALDKMVEVCRRTGMEFWIWDEDYFPSGLAGGRVVWEDPGLISRGLEFSIARVSGTGPFEVDFDPGMLVRAFAVEQRSDGTLGDPLEITPFCGTRRQKWGNRYLLHRAYSPMIDLVGHPHWRDAMDDNRFAAVWTPPTAGDYTLVAALVRSTAGVHPDILRPEGIRRFIEMSHAEYLRRYPAEFGAIIRASFTDEPSPGGSLYPWTARFPDEFRADHGYDLLEHLPHLALEIDARSPAVRHHYRLTQHRLQRAHYVEQISDWCHEHGILSAGHLTRTEWLSLVSVWWPNELRCYQPMDVPTCDPLGASVAWPDAAAYHTGLKVASSAAHLFGRSQAGSDCLAVLGDEASLRDLKYQLDYQMVMGINHFTVHGVSYSIDGPRKDEVPPSIFYQHSEWKHMRVLLDYVRDTAAALTGGEHLCELAVLYPSTSLACQALPETDWYRIPDERLIHDLVEQLLSHQRDFDLIDEVTLQENVSKSGALMTPERYRVILLPHLRYIDAKTADALLRFAGAGGRVVCVGRVPRAITGDLAAPLRDWTDGSIRVLPEVDEDALSGLPGVPVTGEGARDVFVLRRRKEGEILTFVFNRREGRFAGEVDGVPVCIPPRGSALLRISDCGCQIADCSASGQSAICNPTSEILTEGWHVTFEPNQMPLSFWHASAVRETAPRADYGATPFAAPGFDLMARQPDPAGQGDGPARYNCRFMLTGAITDARLVMEDSTIAGEWQVLVNGLPVEGWKRVVEFDCRNIEAPVGHLLRGGSVPTLNVVTVETAGAGRGLKEIPYLYGSFTCEYRYGHLSFPFVRGGSATREVEVLQPWDVLGYPTFSGSAVYRRAVALPEAGDWTLSMGRVEDIAAVSVDGRPAAVRAWKPYRCVLEVLSAGEHLLEIEVTNAPANRYRAAGLPAGLLGPVKMERVG